MLVYEWPPVGVVGREWTVSDPVSVSRSIFDQAHYISAAQPRRRMAVLNVSARSQDDQGAGYMEALKRILRGGLNAVRLNSYPINFRRGPVVPDEVRQSWPISWQTVADNPLAWRAGAGPRGLRWYKGGWNGQIATAEKLETGTSGIGRLRVTGLPPSADIARVGEFVRVYGDIQDTRMLLRPVRSDAGGGATIHLDEETGGGGRINFGVPDTGVFLAEEMPRVTRPNFGDWTYGWSFREIFEREFPDGFTEVDPWG